MTPPPAAAVAARRGLVERPRRPVAPARPRRVSGPARAPATERGRVARRSERRAAGLGGALVIAVAGVCEHRLLDRVLRGRVWIGLVTFALLGIVTLQLALLELNGSIGRALARRAQLMRATSALSIENSSLASGEHVMSAGTAAGMVPVTIHSLRFLDAHGANPAHAAGALRTLVQQPPSEAASAASSAGEASQGGEPASESASSSSSSSSSSEAAGGSEGSQSEAPASQGSESHASESSASQEPAVSEAGGSSAGGGG